MTKDEWVKQLNAIQSAYKAGVIRLAEANDKAIKLNQKYHEELAKETK